MQHTTLQQQWTAGHSCATKSCASQTKLHIAVSSDCSNGLLLVWCQAQWHVVVHQLPCVIMGSIGSLASSASWRMVPSVLKPSRYLAEQTNKLQLRVVCSSPLVCPMKAAFRVVPAPNPLPDPLMSLLPNSCFKLFLGWVLKYCSILEQTDAGKLCSSLRIHAINCTQNMSSGL